MLIAAGLLVLWLLVLIQDLRGRRVRVVVLMGVAGLSLPAAGWPWWPLVVAALVWPLRWRRQALWLAAPAVLVGLATGESSPAVAITAGTVAWSLGWWGGADAVVLISLALRHGRAGLVAAGLVAVVAGLALLVRRRQSAWRLVAAAQDAVALRPVVEGEGGPGDQIPAESEMPAAAALAMAGIVLEVYALCQVQAV